MLTIGQTVTTPEGNTGILLQPGHSGGPARTYQGATQSDQYLVYTVLLDSGKVETWTAAALTGGDLHIRRSPTLD